MANDIIEMGSLKEASIKVQTGMIIVFPHFSREEELNAANLAPKFNGCYATNNSTVCFVSDDEIFVTPYTSAVLKSLKAAGFRKSTFYVPFSNGDYPKEEQERWNFLRIKARLAYEEDFVENCLEYSKKHGIGILKDEILQNCFEMPASGVRVMHGNHENCYYPILNSTYFDSCAMSHIGHFCMNNGRVVFIYCNGNTYVTKGYKIIEELRLAGYTEAGLFVPFSNGEEIMNPVLKERWESITKQLS